MNINDALTLASERLADSREAKCFVAVCLNVDAATLWAHPERSLNQSEHDKLLAWLARREQGYPLAYLEGKQSFWTFDLAVTEATLIPRPETELLVEQVLQHLPFDQNTRALDLGTGSGAIALAIATERQQCQVVAADISLDALQVAKDNAKQLQCHNVSFLQSSWFESVEGQFEVIVSNPPYVETDFDGLDALRFEPQQALVSGKDGLDDLRFIVEMAPRYLKPNGVILLEHGCDQGDAVRELLCSAGFVGVCTHKDLAGLDRVSIGRIK
jgi:release factor glutamine methyltransferase